MFVVVGPLAADEEAAVELFLSGRIRFTDIAPLVEGALEGHDNIAHPTLEQITAAEARAREAVLKSAGGVAK